ncbi:hypothetical protein Hanom_Chr07g00658331 [Helianthus anomalus]
MILILLHEFSLKKQIITIIHIMANISKLKTQTVPPSTLNRYRQTISFRKQLTEAGRNQQAHQHQPRLSRC